jgi:hypothetical protein
MDPFQPYSTWRKSVYKMARLVVLEYKPSLGLPLAALVMGFGFLSLATLGAPNPARIAALVFGGSSAAAGSWVLVYGSRLAASLRRFANSIRIEGEALVLPKTLKLRPGVLKSLYERSPGSDMLKVSTRFEEQGAPVSKSALRPMDFAGPPSVLAGLGWRTPSVGAAIGSMNLVAKSSPVEWVILPAYEVVDREYSVPGASIIVAALVPADHKVIASRSLLTVERERDRGSAELRLSGSSIEGTLHYSRPIISKSRAVRLELEVKRNGVAYSSVVARLSRPGSTRFRLNVPMPEETVYLVTTTHDVRTPRELVRELGLQEPAIIGDAWKGSESKLRLVLETPVAEDAVDETELAVELAS